MLDGSVLLVHTVDKLGIADDDARGVEVVVEGLALTQELGGEEEVELLYSLLSVLDVEAAAVTDGNGGLDNHDGGGVDLEDEVDDFLDMGCVEEVLVRVIVGGGSDDDEVGLPICGTAIKGGC